MIDTLAWGGAQAVLKAYVETRSSLMDRQYVYALRTADRELHISGAVVDPSPSRFSPNPLFRVARFIRQHGIGVLHCHLFRAQVYGYLLKRLVFPRMTLVFHEHGRVLGRESESAVEAFLHRTFLRLSASHVDCYVCVSEHVRVKLTEIAKRIGGKARVVENPIATARRSGQADPGEARRAVGIPNGSFVVGFAGRLVETKGWREFLGAIQLASAHATLFFLLAGDGPDRARVSNTIERLGLAKHGKMLGYVQDMEKFYCALDCLVMPSHWEAHGLTHIEAQSYGVPVIVSDVPGLSGTVVPGENALTFAVGHAPALAERIVALAHDSGLRSVLREGGLVNAKRFSVTQFSRKLDAIYRELAPADVTQTH